VRSSSLPLFLPRPGFKCGPRVLLALTLPELRFLQKKLSLAQKGQLFLSRVFFNEKGALCGPALGAPQAVMLLENLVAAGGKHFWALGWAGALNPDLPLGSLFLPEKSYSLEGTSRHYLPRRRVFQPDPEFFLETQELLKSYGLKPRCAGVVSTDAPYREDYLFWERWSPRVQAVDMETSALLAAAAALGVKLVVLLIISDRIGPSGRKKAPSSLLQQTRRQLFPALSTFLERGGPEGPPSIRT